MSGDVSNPDVAFAAEPTPRRPTPTPEPEDDRKGDRDPLEDRFVWAHYGYSKDRRRYLPASSLLRPPFNRVWSETGAVLLEFGPAIGGRWLYLLKNNGALYAIYKETGKVLLEAQARPPRRRLAGVRRGHGLREHARARGKGIRRAASWR